MCWQESQAGGLWYSDPVPQSAGLRCGTCWSKTYHRLMDIYG